jgi:hypothetical protein
MVLRRKCQKDLKWALPVLIRTSSRTAIRQNELERKHSRRLCGRICKEVDMRKLALGIAAAATLLIGTVAPASAHWLPHYWGGPGIAPGIAVGLVAGTLAAAAVPPVYYGPVYGPAPYYYDYYGPPYRVVRPYPPVYPYWYRW